MGETVDAMDRISELPPFIIHHIMSYLPRKQLSQLSILSKRWNLLRTSFPIFDLDQTDFVGTKVKYHSLSSSRRHKSFRPQLKEFFKFVDASLLRFCQLKFCMQKFRLYISLIDVRASSSLVDNWIRMAVENGVKDLDLHFVTDKNSIYTLPRIIFSASFVINLKLDGCKLEQDFNIMKLYSLRKLTLARVYMNEEMLQNLSSECPLLEDLFFDHCWGFKHFYICRAHKLKIMEVATPPENGLESIEISIPDIQRLQLHNSGGGPRVFDIARCSHLKVLDLARIDFRDQEFRHLVSKLCLLEKLFLSICYSLEKIAISSNWLKVLQVDHCDNLKAFEVDTPNLLSFIYHLNSIPTSSMYAPCPWELYFKLEGDLDTQSIVKLREFLGISNQIEKLTISVKPNKSLLNMNELKESSDSLPCQVEELCLYIDVPSSDYSDLLDCLFWLCYPRTVSLLSRRDDQKEFAKWLYEKLRDRNGNGCNTCHNLVNCWQRNLNDVTVGNFVIEGVKPLNMYTKDSLPILKKGDLEFHLDWSSPVLVEKA